MNKHIYIQNILLIVIGILLISLTLGLRYYEDHLSLLTSLSGKPRYLYNTGLKGIENVKTNIKEDAIFEAVNVKPESNIVTVDAFFTKGNYYEFDITEENLGVKTAKLSSIYLLGTDDASIKYDLTYTDGKKVNLGDTIGPKSSKKIHIKLYREGTETKEKQYNLSLVFNYQEK